MSRKSTVESVMYEFLSEEKEGIDNLVQGGKYIDRVYKNIGTRY